MGVRILPYWFGVTKASGKASGCVTPRALETIYFVWENSVTDKKSKTAIVKGSLPMMASDPYTRITPEALKAAIDRYNADLAHSHRRIKVADDLQIHDVMDVAVELDSPVNAELIAAMTQESRISMSCHKEPEDV